MAVCFVLMGLAFVLYPEGSDYDPTALRAFGIVCMALFGGAALVSARGALGPAGFVALLEEGVLFRSAAGRSFVPWDSVTGLVEYEIRGSAAVGFEIAGSAGIERSGPARLLAPLERRWFGSDLSVAENLLVVDLEVLVRALERSVDDPSVREKLGTSESLEQLGLTAAVDRVA